MNICIEQYHHDQEEQIVDLIIGIQTREFGIPITIADQPDLLTIPEFYQKGAGNFWVACDGDKVVGTVALIDIGERQAALRKMFVAPQYRGREKGVANALLSELLAWARKHQLREIILGTTAKYHAAHRFYEKNGFQQVDQKELPPNFPIMAVDTRFYRLELG